MAAQVGNVPQPEQQDQQPTGAASNSQPAAAMSTAILPLQAMGAMEFKKALFDLSDSLSKDCSARRRTTPSPKGFRHASPSVKGVRLPLRRLPSATSEEPRRGRRSMSRRPCFPDSGKATHERLQMDPAVSDAANMNIMVRQQQFDREDMLVLKAAIEPIHESHGVQQLELATYLCFDGFQFMNVQGFDARTLWMFPTPRPLGPAGLGSQSV